MSETAAALRIFDVSIPPHLIAGLRKAPEVVLGRRPLPADGNKDMRWWFNLKQLGTLAAPGAVESILGWYTGSPFMTWAREVLGDDDLEFVLDYCNFRYFVPERRPHRTYWHFDANIFGPETPMVNVWIPLDDVGETAPGLQVVRQARSPRRIWEHLENLAAANGGRIDGQNRSSTLYSDEAVTREIAREPGLRSEVPRLRAGAGIGFTGHYLHSTQEPTPAMGSRMSLEMRVLPRQVIDRMGFREAYQVMPAANFRNAQAAG